MDASVERIIKEIVPELYPTKYESRWSWEFFPKYRNEPYYKFRAATASLAVGLTFWGGFWWGDSLATSDHYMIWFGVGMIKIGLCCLTANALLSYLFYRKLRKLQPVAKRPRIEVVQQRMLTRMEREIHDGKQQVQGKDSAVENRIIELKAKRNDADSLRKRFSVKKKEASADRYKHFALREERAIIARDKLDAELAILGAEQQRVLKLFSDMEAFLPAEQSRIEDDLLDAKLLEIEGNASQAREVSREMLMQTVVPTVEKLLVLNAARERLLSHSLTALEPITIDRFISSIEAGAESVARVDGALRRIESGVENGLIS